MPSLTAKSTILSALRAQLRLISGSDSGSRATVTVSIGDGAITAVTITGAGSNYDSNPLVTISGGGGSGASLRAKVLAGQDSVSEVEIVSGGSGFTSVPTVIISPPAASYNSLLFNNVFRDFKFLQEINDFPTICFTTGRLTREHIGAGVIYETFRVNIRGYVMSDNSIESCEDLAEDVERVVNRLRDVRTSSFAQPIVESRVLSVRTDEGLFEPYGVVDIAAEITYDYETLGLAADGDFILLEGGDGFLLTEGGDFIILDSPTGPSFLLLEDGVGQLLAEDGSTLTLEN